MTLRRYNCRNVRDMLPLHVGGDLDPRHVNDVDEHLHSCLSCFREFRELATMRGRLGVLGEAPLASGILDGFTEEVMARIAVGEPGPAAQLPRRASVLTLPRVAAAAAILLAATIGLSQFDIVGGENQPDSSSGASTPVRGSSTGTALPLVHDGSIGPDSHSDWLSPSNVDLAGNSGQPTTTARPDRLSDLDSMLDQLNALRVSGGGWAGSPGGLSEQVLTGLRPEDRAPRPRDF